MTSLQNGSRLRTRLRAFAKNVRGNVAITFGLAAIPVIAIAGAAIDFARLGGVQARVQAVLDSATMAGAAPRGIEAKLRSEIAAKYFADNYQVTGAGDQRPDARFTLDNGVFKGSVESKVKASLMPLLGIDELSVSVASEVKLQTMTAAEVVLALDYSSSMLDNGKWTAMRQSALKLVEDLSGGTDSANLRIGLVPFAGHVYTTMPGGYIAGASVGKAWTNCTTDRKWPYNTEDTAPVINIEDSKWGQDFDEYKDECKEYPRRNLTIKPLTSDVAAVKQQLNAMTPYQGTHIALGLEFARHLLSPSEPFSEGAAFNDKKWKKFIILLTDGEQTSKGWGKSNAHNQSWAEKNTEAMCKDAKTQGVIVFTIAFDLGKSGNSRKRLEECASSSEFFFDARTNGELASAFDAISGLLVNSPYFQR